MAIAKAIHPQADRRLDLQRVVADLVADGLVAQETADQLLKDRRFGRADVHPLVVIADQKWKDPWHPKKLLHREALTQWLAEKSGMRYLRIDPFKIEVATVTKV